MRRVDVNGCRERGSALVESTLTLLAFVGILLATFDFGQILFVQHMLADRVRTAVRYGSINPADTEGIRNLVLFGTTVRPDGAAPPAALTSEMVEVERTGAGTPVERIAVTLKGYRLQFSNPLLPAAFTGRTIASTLPVEGS